MSLTKNKSGRKRHDEVEILLGLLQGRWEASRFGPLTVEGLAVRYDGASTEVKTPHMAQSADGRLFLGSWRADLKALASNPNSLKWSLGDPAEDVIHWRRVAPVASQVPQRRQTAAAVQSPVPATRTGKASSNALPGSAREPGLTAFREDAVSLPEEQDRPRERRRGRQRVATEPSPRRDRARASKLGHRPPRSPQQCSPSQRIPGAGRGRSRGSDGLGGGEQNAGHVHPSGRSLVSGTGSVMSPPLEVMSVASASDDSDAAPVSSLGRRLTQKNRHTPAAARRTISGAKPALADSKLPPPDGPPVRRLVADKNKVPDVSEQRRRPRVGGARDCEESCEEERFHEENELHDSAAGGPTCAGCCEPLRLVKSLTEVEGEVCCTCRRTMDRAVPLLVCTLGADWSGQVSTAARVGRLRETMTGCGYVICAGCATLPHSCRQPSRTTRASGGQKRRVCGRAVFGPTRSVW